MWFELDSIEKWEVVGAGLRSEEPEGLRWLEDIEVSSEDCLLLPRRDVEMPELEAVGEVVCIESIDCLRGADDVE